MQFHVITVFGSARSGGPSGGFTGSSWNAETTAPATPVGVEADAEITDGVFTISGTAMGFYQDDPAETTTAEFEIRTDC